MYIWIGLVFSKETEEKIRNICKDINKDYNLNEVSFSLPQHISLKTSFFYDNYLDVIEYIKKLLSNIKPVNITITGINKINNGVIWLDILENDKLRTMHNLLNNELLKRFNIPLIKYDGENFKFHSALFQDKNISDKHNEMINLLNNRFNLPIDIELLEINIGLSKTGEVGTYKVYEVIK